MTHGNLTTPLLILAGGFGTRLRSAVGDVPKPVAPIAGLPFLAHLIFQAYKCGVREFILSLHHEPEKIKSALRTVAWPSDLIMKFVVEPKPMGTGGAIAYAYNELHLHGPILICNGDTYFEAGFQSAIEKLEISQNSAVLALCPVENASRYGTVKCDDQGRILEFREKTGTNCPGVINMGLYAFSEEFIRQLPEGAHSIETDVFQPLSQKGVLESVLVETPFIDIGIPEDYERFRNQVEAGKIFPPNWGE